MSDAKPEMKAPDICRGQREKTARVEAELGQLHKRLSRAKIAPVCTFAVYAFNCDLHGIEDYAHFEWVAAGGKQEIPGGLKAAVDGLEHLLTTLKARVQ